MIRASDYECQSLLSSGFNPSILRLSGVFGAVSEGVLNILVVRKNPGPKRLEKKSLRIYLSEKVIKHRQAFWLAAACNHHYFPI